MIPKERIRLIALGCVVACGSVIAQAQVVYDNTTTAINVGHGFATTEGGDEITLAGTCRVVTSLDLGFSSPIGTADLIVRLYANDGPVNGTTGTPEPGTLLFDSGTLSVPATISGFNTFTVSVPNITVPDTFTWTIQRLDAFLTVARYDPPTVGSSADFFWSHFAGTFWSPTTSFAADNLYARVTVGGGGAPSISCPPDATLECPADTSVIALGEATAQGCGTATIAHSDSSLSACAGSEIITRTWTAQIGADTATCDQFINVVDTVAPQLVGVPADLIVECDAISGPAVVTATDSCDVAPTVTLSESQTAGNCLVDFSLIRTWTAADACGNTSVGTQVITAQDTTPPVASATLVPLGNGDKEGSSDDDDDEGSFVVMASCSDNCGGIAGCSATTLSAVLSCSSGQSVSVSVGQVVEIELEDEGHCEIEMEDGRLEIEGDVTLIVTCTDASGNASTAIAIPPGLAPDNDDETEDDD